MAANAWKRRRAKNPRRDGCHRIKRRAVQHPRPCRLCGALFVWWQWEIGIGDKAGLSRGNCGCWFDNRTAEGVAKGTP